MRKNINSLFVVMFGVALMGCSMFSHRHGAIYPMSYDQMYNTTLDALDDMNNWRVVGTDQTKGRIVAERDPSFWEVNQETQVAFIVERIAPFKTKVSLDGHVVHPFNKKFFKSLERRYQERALTYPS